MPEFQQSCSLIPSSMSLFTKPFRRLPKCDYHRLTRQTPFTSKAYKPDPRPVHSQSPTDADTDSYDYGHYSVILPPEPFIFGTSHIKPRHVPAHIIRPPYAMENPSQKAYDSYEGNGIIELGGEEERRLRASASLAREVLSYVDSLIKVRITTQEVVMW